jgi:hypothetical protein
MLGMIIEDDKKNGEHKYALITFILAPFLLPIFIGMELEKQTKK